VTGKSALRPFKKNGSASNHDKVRHVQRWLTLGAAMKSHNGGNQGGRHEDRRNYGHRPGTAKNTLNCIDDETAEATVRGKGLR